jgi:hypothetical protein
MTTITISTGQEAIAAAAAGVVVGLFVLSYALGWIRFSLSIGAVPPWNRKAKKTPDSVPAIAAEPREAAKAPIAGAAPVKPVRRAG